MKDLIELTDECACPRQRRRLAEDDGETWEIVYTSLVLFLMFAALVSDRVGADSVMLTSLTAFMAAEIISVKEGLEGFANEGLLTVLALFVVAEGISKTGALDWYMGKLLGRPTSAPSAQFRLMVPVAIVSAFLNNTPIVAVMIPIVQRWAKNIQISQKQLLIPLSFASILGGTCTLIGTSTNLVVVGLLNDRYPNDDEVSIGLFDLGQFGVPVAMAGIAYVLLASPFLLSDGKRESEGESPLENNEDILLGARLTQWSPAAGRTVQRSGLRDTGGIYLVSVHRAATGNVHRAVSNDFVLNVGDILYFTGLVESFGEFCEEHGLEVVTNEVEVNIPESGGDASKGTAVPRLVTDSAQLDSIEETSEAGAIPVEVGVTKESLLQADEDERLRNINRMTDLIRGVEPSEDTAAPMGRPKRRRYVSEMLQGNDPPKIVVTIDKDLVVAGINSRDRPGLLLDISKGLLRLNLQLRHTEAAVVEGRSVSIWRCEVIGTELPDVEEIWSVLNAMLSSEEGIEAIKKRGLRVIRARVVKGSRLVGKTAQQVDFRHVYKAAIVAVQKGGKNVTQPLSAVRFDVGDILVLQASDDSPLLHAPPPDFYKVRSESKKDLSIGSRRNSSVRSLVNLMTGRSSGANLESLDRSSHGETLNGSRDWEDSKQRNENGDGGDFYIPSGEGSHEAMDNDEESALQAAEEAVEELQQANREQVWRDLRPLLKDDVAGDGGASREFLTAMAVAPGSKLAGKTVAQIGISKLPDIFLVSIDRPVVEKEGARRVINVLTAIPDASSVEEASVVTQAFKTIEPDEPLKEGDVLWFSGSASAVGDLRKIPGLASYQKEEVEKINEKVHDRRLVQAVIARKGPLVGKTVKELQFRTKYGAAVIAVHREGKRVHEHPGKVKLQAGDVLLLEAGPSFIARTRDNDRSFALLSEVEDSAPPRLRLLIPALLIAIAMLAVFTAGVTSLLICALVASILMVVLGILSEQEARDAVNWDVYVTIASAFGIGTALVNSGVAKAIASFLVNIGTGIGIGDAGLIGAVYFATFLISNVVTNNAAAALLFPIALDAAEQTGTDRVLMAYTLMLGASASFMSPFGYTTNLLIYGPGGYKTMDFVRFGTPMQIVLWVLSTAFLSVVEPWYVSWLATFAILIIVLAVRSSSAADVLLARNLRARRRERKDGLASETRETD